MRPDPLPLPHPEPPACDGPALAGPPRTGRWRFSARGRVLRIDAAWPEGPPPPGGHPFLLLLDGNAFFFTLVETARIQALRPSGGEPVVIGLGYETDAPFDVAQRTRDYPPPGGGAFLDLLAEDLLPWLLDRLHLNRAAGALIGHSLGGLFVLQTLYAAPALFRAYVAASPSLWFDRAAMAGATISFAERLAGLAPPLHVLVTAGGLERAGTRTGDAALDARLAERRVAEEARALAEQLAAYDPARLRVRFDLFEGETHGSIVPAMLARAVPFARAAWECR